MSNRGGPLGHSGGGGGGVPVDDHDLDAAAPDGTTVTQRRRDRPVGAGQGRQASKSGPHSSARVREREIWQRGPDRFKYISKYSNQIQTHSNLICSKWDLPELENFEIIYGYEGFDVINNFPYRNFLRFEKDLELKIKGTCRD
jgi:hypothetical protein